MKYTIEQGCMRTLRSSSWLQISLLLGIATLWLVGVASASPPVPSLAPSDTGLEEEVYVKIRARQFEPTMVVLTLNRKTKLVFHNLDAELHTFVPVGLFVGVNLNISGNGAPEFGKKGFKRIIIPSQGKAEFRFVPTRPGVYPFYCDMPGHEMRATIVIK
ncbi:MAG: cupredoxin domain-containing protein [Nitrospirae bacterium]|nr:cupredoxin domain-containing protein [Nitrospirota bacterium]